MHRNVGEWTHKGRWQLVCEAYLFSVTEFQNKMELSVDLFVPLARATTVCNSCTRFNYKKDFELESFYS